MPARINRTRIINRKTAQYRPVDPAQSGAYYARLNEQRLTITGVRNQIVFRAQGVLAARWENEETILLVLREEPEDEPIVERAFQPRARREWDIEDAHAAAHLSPSGTIAAVEFRIPNASVAVLPTGRVVHQPLAHANLSGPAESIAWTDDGKQLSITAPQQRLSWILGQHQFKKVADHPT